MTECLRIIHISQEPILELAEDEGEKINAGGEPSSHSAPSLPMTLVTITQLSTQPASTEDTASHRTAELVPLEDQQTIFQEQPPSSKLTTQMKEV